MLKYQLLKLLFFVPLFPIGGLHELNSGSLR